jgi:hypothetical protein
MAATVGCVGNNGQRRVERIGGIRLKNPKKNFKKSIAFFKVVW